MLSDQADDFDLSDFSKTYIDSEAQPLDSILHTLDNNDQQQHTNNFSFNPKG